MKITYLDQYHCFNETIMPENPTIIKVGIAGATGCDDMAKAKELYPGCKTIAFEADPDNYEANQEKAEGKIDKFYNKAIGEKGKIKLYRFKNVVSNSVYPRHKFDANCKLRNTVKVDSLTLKDALRRYRIKYVDLLITNCEGGELPILASLLEDETLREKIGQLCVSFHAPRIYEQSKQDALLEKLAPLYHIFRGVDCQKGGIPDHLLIRKV